MIRPGAFQGFPELSNWKAGKGPRSFSRLLRNVSYWLHYSLYSELSRLSRNRAAGKLESAEMLGFSNFVGAFQSFPASCAAGKLESRKKSQ
jgi:hypothetical protein